MKLIKSFFLAVVVLMASTNFAFSQTTPTTQQTETVKTINVKVKGISCSTDLKMIAANVEKLEGVSSCKTAKKGTTTTFKIKMNAALVTEKEIHAAIENTGSCENPNERPYKVKL